MEIVNMLKAVAVPYGVLHGNDDDEHCCRYHSNWFVLHYNYKGSTEFLAIVPHPHQPEGKQNA